MEKRVFKLVDSPKKVLQHDVNKRMKISISPKKSLENNGNIMNTASTSDDFNFDGLIFDDDDDSFLETVLKVRMSVFKIIFQ